MLLDDNFKKSCLIETNLYEALFSHEYLGGVVPKKNTLVLSNEIDLRLYILFC